jgi:hypothetical protein
MHTRVSKLWAPIRYWLPVQWVPLELAADRIATYTGDWILAGAEMRQYLLAGGLHASLVKQARSPSMQASCEVERWMLKPAAWQTLFISCFGGGVTRIGGREIERSITVRGTIDDYEILPFKDWHGFVGREGLDRLYPLLPAAAPETVTPSPHRRPGPKPKGNWPELVAQELIRRAVDEGDRLGNTDALVKHMQDFLQTEIEWAPDPKELKPVLAKWLGRTLR